MENDSIFMIQNSNRCPKNRFAELFLFIDEYLSLLTWPSCIASKINIKGWNYVPKTEARVSLCIIPIGLRATLCLIRYISVC